MNPDYFLVLPWHFKSGILEREKEFIAQGEYEDRSIEDSLNIGWKLLSSLPQHELKRAKKEHIEKYMPKKS